MKWVLCRLIGHKYYPETEPESFYGSALYIQEEECSRCGMWRAVGGFLEDEE